MRRQEQEVVEINFREVVVKKGCQLPVVKADSMCQKVWFAGGKTDDAGKKPSIFFRHSVWIRAVHQQAEDRIRFGDAGPVFILLDFCLFGCAILLGARDGSLQCLDGDVGAWIAR